ncbi:hypothetical protein SQ03_15585 [Methylobacterium platani JCM 14648]|uniref:histidine kinase n=3 Tax=Methylobacterium platani TaxID=427683 RepID=A0A179SBT8_9HYPH|nr:hypothetical protein SQ03_15585 [Methylobacterium platani JCM 14648]OAS24922.1 hypothetical protein A5481_12330 [Methylobacterium platani]
MGALMRAHDWAASPLGPSADWPQPLKTLVEVMLAAGQPMFVAWGPERTLLYNDPYAVLMADRHPAGLGRPFFEVWPDIADVCLPLFARVFSGEPVHMDEIELHIDRPGRAREAFFSFSYTPVSDEGGMVAGVFCACSEITAQKAAERAEKRSKARLETALRVARLGTFEWFPATGLVDLDARSREIYDVPEAGDVQAGDIFSRVAPEDFDRVVTRCTEVIERASHPDADPLGERISLDYDFLVPDGSRRAISSSGVVFKGEDGIWRMLGAIGDVTEIRRAEARLRDQNATLEQRVEERTAERNRIWQVSQDMLLVCDFAGVFQTVNPAWARVLGWSEAEMVGRTSEWLEHPDDRERTRAEVRRLAESGAPTLAFENRYRTRAGDYRHLSWTAVPEGGRIYCVARDVTEEKAQEAELAARTAERDRSWRLAQELLVVASPDGTLEAVNSRWTTLLGWTEGELVGSKFISYTHPEDLDATLVAFAGIFEKPLTEPYVYRFRGRDGSYRWFGWTAAFEEGRVYAAGRDVTVEREQAEALRQSQKMEAVGQLTGGLAHDFNNLLAGISGSLEMMQNRMQQGRFHDVERYMAVAQGASKRAAALTHRLLAFSRRQTLDPKPTDVNRLALGMQEMIQRTVGPSIPIEVVGAAGLWPALVDPSQLENALLNLCINARDAMPGGGRITVETANRWLDERASRKLDMPEGQYLSLCVTDTGTGMRPEVVARVFEPFFTTKPIGEGTGLGLSMIYGFAQQSGGQVRIYSEVGQGTTVCIYLPRHYGEVEDDEQSAKLDALPRSEQGETVLVVDDEPSVRMLVTDILEDLGYTSIEAGDSAAGLKVLQSNVRIDLLVTDVGLPGGMNGRQMADAARVSRPNLKVLFITGYAENAILGNGHLAPGMAVLTKPFPVETMAARIRSMIEGGKEQARRA